MNTEFAKDIMSADIEASKDCSGIHYEIMADALTSAGYRKPRTITNIEECVALADGSVILTKGGIVFRKYVGWFKEGKDGWIRCTFGQNDPLTIESLGYNDYAHFPATVIHEGDTK